MTALTALPLSSVSSIPIGLIVVIAVLGLLELTLAVVALVVLVRTPRDRVTLPKWAWALLIVLVNLIGSILFLAIGRRPAPAVIPTTLGEPDSTRPSASSVADALYGDGTPSRAAPPPDDEPGRQ